MTRIETFHTGPRLRLALANLTAPVAALAGDAAYTARVDITGDVDWRDAVNVAYDPAGNRLTVSEAPGRWGHHGGVTVSDGSVVINSGIVIGNGTTQVNTFRAGGASTVIHGMVGGRVVVNGVDITDTVNQTRPPVGPDRAITITVPTGTDTGIDDCHLVRLDGIQGRLRVDLDGTGEVHASDATGVRLQLAGQATATVTRSTGPVSVKALGQATARLDGDYGDVDLILTGQASVTGHGTYGHVGGQAMGQCTVDLKGQAAGQSVRQVGQCTVRIQGATRPATSRSDWGF